MKVDASRFLGTIWQLKLREDSEAIVFAAAKFC